MNRQTLKVRKSVSPGLFNIYRSSGGVIPDALKGDFTSPKIALASINIWSLAREAKIIANTPKIRKKVVAKS